MADAMVTPGLFSTLVMGLSSAALIELGVVVDPANNEKRVNKDSARQHIEILSMLQKKTAGNLDDNEKALLERAIVDLKMQFAKI